MPIHINCYLAVLKRFREKYPNAHFEVITRVAHHPLSPSWKLLNKIKHENISWEEYTTLFLNEMESPSKKKELYRLQEIAQKKDLYLVCYEKDATHCHRSLVKKLIEDL